jgi:Flp pilus assembly protein CpaB
LIAQVPIMRPPKNSIGAWHQAGLAGWRGEHSVKRQTLILVVIGVVLFVAGGGIAFTTVMNGSKQQPSATVAPVSTPVVVATKTIAAGTTGQDMVAQGLVSVQLISQKKYLATDLPSLQGLTDEVLTSSVTKGDAIQASQLTPSATSISLPKGLDGVTVTVGGASGLAGYLQPGSDVDVYANITKLSQGGAATPTQSNLPIPCTELVMSNVEVLDVSSVVPALGSHPSLTGRAVPNSVTLLLAVNPSQARLTTFMSLNETLSVTQTQKGAVPTPVGQCVGTAQTTIAP